MTLRDYTWELTVSVFSWVVAIGALALVVAYLAFEAVKSRREGRR